MGKGWIITEKKIDTLLDEGYFNLPEKKIYPKNRQKSNLSRKEYQKQWKLKNKESQKDYQKIYQRRHYRDNPEKYLYWSIKHRAKQKNLPFNLELSDLTIPTHCPILEIPIQRNIGKLSRAQNSPSVDRIVPELGYVKGNIQIISMRANVMKNDASPEELRRFAHWVTKTYPPS